MRTVKCGKDTSTDYLFDLHISTLFKTVLCIHTQPVSCREVILRNIDLTEILVTVDSVLEGNILEKRAVILSRKKAWH